ncbi:MAG: cytochrome d ubiquinol oxidase subunit II [Acidimicrobiales bacterium]
MDRAVAVFLWLAVTAYALTGGADFGGGIWDLLAGGPRRGMAVRALIDDSINPVWEANHVWLIIDLVILWTAFPPAFAAITSTLFVPLSLVALGTLLRGSGFALRKLVRGVTLQTVTGGVFALSSVITPLFLGAAVGAIATGRVPATGTGGEISSWTSPTSWLLGALAVSAFAYLAAVYLVNEARRRDLPELERYFRIRALVAAVVTGAVGGASLVYLHTSAPRTFHNLVEGRGLPLFAASVVLGGAAVVLLLARRSKIVRPVAAGAFAAMIWGWGAAQYPYLLPRSMTLMAGAAPQATLVAETVVVGAMVLLLVPSFLYLFRLAAKGRLTEEGLGAGATIGGGEH